MFTRSFWVALKRVCKLSIELTQAFTQKTADAVFFLLCPVVMA